ncbi:hypothetical protein GGS20DRAFT_527448 [Poronia punctata]|nr:hypothetical protein GGS20DRAFT_527448 [Poronia punctata]
MLFVESDVEVVAALLLTYLGTLHFLVALDPSRLCLTTYLPSLCFVFAPVLFTYSFLPPSLQFYNKSYELPVLLI